MRSIWSAHLVPYLHARSGLCSELRCITMLLLYVTVIAQVSLAHALGTYGVLALVTTVSGACKKKKIQALIYKSPSSSTVRRC